MLPQIPPQIEITARHANQTAHLFNSDIHQPTCRKPPTQRHAGQFTEQHTCLPNDPPKHHVNHPIPTNHQTTYIHQPISILTPVQELTYRRTNPSIHQQIQPTFQPSTNTPIFRSGTHKHTHPSTPIKSIVQHNHHHLIRLPMVWPIQSIR